LSNNLRTLAGPGLSLFSLRSVKSLPLPPADARTSRCGVASLAFLPLRFFFFPQLGHLVHRFSVMSSSFVFSFFFTSLFRRRDPGFFFFFFLLTHDSFPPSPASTNAPQPTFSTKCSLPSSPPAEFFFHYPAGKIPFANLRKKNSPLPPFFEARLIFPRQ